MELRHLKYLRTLVAIASYGGFSAAGEALGLTQSAVSLHVRALEEALGVELFDRRRRPPRLNARGAAAVERAREIVRLCQAFDAAIAPDAVSGVLELGAVPTVLSGVLPDALARLRAAHADLGVHLTSGMSRELAAAVRRARLDAAIVSEPIGGPGELHWYPVDAEPLMAIAPAGTPGESDRELLAAGPFIRLRRYAWAGRLIDAELRARGIAVRTTMEVDSLEAVSLMVSRGLGVSVAPRRSIGEPFPPGIRSAPFGDPPVRRVIGLVERADNPKSGLVGALHEVLCAQCAGNR